MAKENRFSTIASGLLEEAMQQNINLTKEQAAVKVAYEQTNKALKESASVIENARRESIRAINEKAAKNIKEINNHIDELSKAYHKELVNLGVREEDIPLIESNVVKRADAVTNSDGLKNGASK